jgi:hypothetical protein
LTADIVGAEIAVFAFLARKLSAGLVRRSRESDELDTGRIQADEIGFGLIQASGIIARRVTIDAAIVAGLAFERFADAVAAMVERNRIGADAEDAVLIGSGVQDVIATAGVRGIGAGGSRDALGRPAKIRFIAAGNTVAEGIARNASVGRSTNSARLTYIATRATVWKIDVRSLAGTGIAGKRRRIAGSGLGQSRRAADEQNTARY